MADAIDSPDGYLTLAEAAAVLPGRPHLSTLHRWRLRGVRGVKLQTCLIGGRRFTTRSWLRDFIEAGTGSASLGSPHLNKRRETTISEAERFLEMEGCNSPAKEDCLVKAIAAYRLHPLDMKRTDDIHINKAPTV